jgi:hypothetical protein
MKLGKQLLAAALAGVLAAPAFAQVNYVPQVGTLSAVLKEYTYSAVSIGLVPPASATDIFCISGAASRSISVKQIRLSITGTAASVPFTLLRRVSLDTGGTAATGNAAPVAVPNNSADPTSIATLIAYTAVPTIVDTSPSLLRSEIYVTAASTAQGRLPLVWQAGDKLGVFTKAFDLNKAVPTQQLCINMNATSVTSPVVDVDITWTEQP